MTGVAERRLPALHDAVNSGDMVRVQEILERGANINARDDQGRTALHWAAGNRYSGRRLVTLLLSKGAEVCASDNGGDMPLHDAARADDDWNDPIGTSKYERTVYQLIANGADVNARNGGGFTPLHLAAICGSSTAARLLIAKGADVNAETIEEWKFVCSDWPNVIIPAGTTALGIAVMIPHTSGHQYVAEAVFEAGGTASDHAWCHARHGLTKSKLLSTQELHRKRDQRRKTRKKWWQLWRWNL